MRLKTDVEEMVAEQAVKKALKEKTPIRQTAMDDIICELDNTSRHYEDLLDRLVKMEERIGGPRPEVVAEGAKFDQPNSHISSLGSQSRKLREIAEAMDSVINNMESFI